MKNNTIKSMFNEKIDKEKIYNNVLNYKKRNILKYSSLVLTSIIFICAVVLLNYNNRNVLDSHILQEESFININIVKDIYPNYSISANTTLYTNELASTIEYDRKINEDEDQIKDINISDDLKLTSKLAVDNLYDDVESHPIYELVYKNTSSERKVKIIYSKDKYVTENYKNPKALNLSKINNTELLIYRYENTYRAIFTIDDLYYRIESNNLTEEEFISLLESIIKE